MTGPTFDPASHYDRVTAAWSLLLGADLHYGLFSSGEEDLPAATKNLTTAMLEAGRIEPGMRVLDVGCGTGAPACLLAEEVGATVLGITTSPVGVSQATARALERRLDEQVRFEIRDGMANGLPDASFDRVWVLESSHLMRDRARLVSECARVLRPGGRFVLCDIVLRRVMPFDEVRSRRDQLGLLREVFGDARMEPVHRYRQLAEQHGLVVDVERDLTAGTRRTFDCWRDNARRHHDPVVASLGQQGLDRFLESCDVLESFWDDGTLGYALVAATRSPAG